MKGIFAVLVCAALCASGLTPVAGQDIELGLGTRGPQYVPGEMLVQFRAGSVDSDIERALGRAGAELADVVRSSPASGHGRGDLVLARFRPEVPAAAAERAVGLDPAVEFAEPNWIYQHQAVANDTYAASGQLWGMTGTYGSGASNAWAAGRYDCGSVYVGIIDEGYMYEHTDIAANAGKNPGDSTFNGVDDDGNGYVDDVYGWDFDGGNNSVFDGTTDDHGTHVAGTIGGVGNNGAGVAGVCWNVKLLSAKFLGRRGGTTANAVKAVDYFTNLKKAGTNIVATNNSWGGGGFSQALKDAIDRANAENILFIAAAGNDGTNNDATASYPGNYTSANVIAVASITSSGALSSFSQYGLASVDLGAPGSSIISTVPAKSGKSVVSGYASYSGTSMATPHVTGAAALYAAYHGGASAATIKAAILGSTIATPSLNGKCVTGGRLNVSGF